MYDTKTYWSYAIESLPIWFSLSTEKTDLKPNGLDFFFSNLTRSV